MSDEVINTADRFIQVPGEEERKCTSHGRSVHFTSSDSRVISVWDNLRNLFSVMYASATVLHPHGSLIVSPERSGRKR